MNRWHNYYCARHAHFCTATISDWRPLLYGEAIRVLYEEWQSARLALGVKILAYVIMPEHFHMVLWADDGASVSKFLHRVLSCTSRRLQPGGGLWKERPRVLPIYSGHVLKVKVNYIHENPVRRGLTENIEDWPHSSYHQLELGQTNKNFTCDDWGQIST